MNIQTEPFKAEHMKSIAHNIIEQTYTPQEWCLWAERNEQTSNALTAYVNGKVIACGGVRMYKTVRRAKQWKRLNRTSKVIEKWVTAVDNTMWVVLDKDAANHKKELIYAANIFMKILAPEHKALKCQVCAGFKEGHRFVEHLGFKSLGTQSDLGFDDYERVAA